MAEALAPDLQDDFDLANTVAQSILSLVRADAALMSQNSASRLQFPGPPALLVPTRLATDLQFVSFHAEKKSFFFIVTSRDKTKKLMDVRVSAALKPSLRPVAVQDEARPLRLSVAFPKGMSPTFPTGATIALTDGRTLAVDRKDGKFQVTIDQANVGTTLKSFDIVAFLRTLMDWLRTDAYGPPFDVRDGATDGGEGLAVDHLLALIGDAYSQVLTTISPAIAPPEGAGYDILELRTRALFSIDDNGELVQDTGKKGTQQFDTEADLLLSQSRADLHFYYWLPDFLFSGDLRDQLVQTLIAQDDLDEFLRDTFREEFHVTTSPSEWRDFLNAPQLIANAVVVRINEDVGDDMDFNLFVLESTFRGKPATVMLGTKCRVSPYPELKVLKVDDKDRKYYAHKIDAIDPGHWLSLGDGPNHAFLSDDMKGFIERFFAMLLAWRALVAP